MTSNDWLGWYEKSSRAQDETVISLLVIARHNPPSRRETATHEEYLTGQWFIHEHLLRNCLDGHGLAKCPIMELRKDPLATERTASRRVCCLV